MNLKAIQWIGLGLSLVTGITGLGSLALGASPVADHELESMDKTVPHCAGSRPVLFEEFRMPLAKAALPEKVLVGREVNIWVSNETTGLQIWARQNFKTGKKSFVCATLPPNTSTHVSFPLIVLFDRSKEAKVGDSLWQMQLMAQNSKLGLWSQKTRLMTVTELVSERQNSWNLEWSHGTLEETELRSSAKQGDLQMIAVIRFDHVEPSNP